MANNLTKTNPRDITLGGFTLSAVGVVAKGNPSIEEWQAAMQFVNHAGGAVMWWFGDLLVHGERSYGDLASQEDGDGKFEKETLYKARYVSEQVPICIRMQTLAWAHHQIVAPLSSSDQKKWLVKAAEGENGKPWSVARLRQETADHRARKTLSETPLPKGKHHVIYADPPWRYDFSQSDSLETPRVRKNENLYPTMDLEMICGMEAEKLAAADCVLFLWATSPKLEEAFRVMESWGFEYKTCMVWKKDKAGPGYYARQQHEILLIGTIGLPPQSDPSIRPASVIEAPRTEHSKKPEVFYEIIEELYPDTKKVELFCRNPRDGWAAWGGEFA